MVENSPLNPNFLALTTLKSKFAKALGIRAGRRIAVMARFVGFFLQTPRSQLVQVWGRLPP